MDVATLISEAGSISALAVRLSVTRQTVYTWQARGIPETRQSWIREQWPEGAKAAQGKRQ